MVITVDLANCEIRKTLVDQGSSVDVLYKRTFKKMRLDDNERIPLDEQIVGFSSEWVDTKGYIDLDRRFGTENYLCYVCGSGCQHILQCAIRMIVLKQTWRYSSTPHLAMKFPFDRGGVATVHAYQRMAWECYVVSLKLTSTETTVKRNINQRMVALTDLDPRVNDEVK